MVDATTAFSGFSVRDVPEARAFYEGVLGVPVTEEHGMLSLQVGGTHVLVYPKGPAHEPASFTVLNFPVPDVDAAVDELTAAGVRFLQYDGVTDERGVNRNGGPLIAWFTDPSGNVLSIVEQESGPSR
ncbi:catechol 2,3-dioxygenase-like lactoylglutathione lyase family enzyme [Curtobacterium luteum]|uniref:Catechol 2,3-dioxygenase-like lactoylglutathione lyase family enzyme n=1 Tax=Curtobacterium luteum TaxID=33881 RepID=A0A8H9L1H7_9MICO|nr:MULTISPECIES: VOC family protein [Curtobacterium]MBM7803452.1 catechol 2,3-dioxygenase-like lactoylglutathione lyase family enzyme [Curtobacterium luteum]NUU49614.1 VOC family protein [Curtobacterium luteum]GGL10921.1 glyoxalase [Curtobacterium luteum]